jgi:hypothetical protein
LILASFLRLRRKSGLSPTVKIFYAKNFDTGSIPIASFGTFFILHFSLMVRRPRFALVSENSQAIDRRFFSFEKYFSNRIILMLKNKKKIIQNLFKDEIY